MNESAAREEIMGMMRRLEPRPVHVEHVASLALQLFDQLASVHGLGPRERLLLEAAGHLHDIGHTVGNSETGHHVESARMIREHSWNNFAPAEVEVIAQVARYHRKSMPELSHEAFRTLGDTERRIVQRLAAILRLADSFDRSHVQLIRSVRVELPVNRIVFHFEIGGPVLRELQTARLKSDLAQAVFQRDLVFMVDGEELVPAQ